MTIRTIALPAALLAVLALAIAACGGPAATATPGATLPAGPTAAPTTGVPATQGPQPTDGALPSIDLSSFHADVDLEELFPDELGGQPVFVVSQSGEEFMGTGATIELEAALRALGKSPSDLSVAFGGTIGTVIIAFKVDGVSGSAILDALFDAYAEQTGGVITDASFGGKSVKRVVLDGATTYVYGAQDVVFSVGGAAMTDALLTELFTKLP